MGHLRIERRKEIEDIADSILKKRDPEALIKTKRVDIYMIIEQEGYICDWKYLDENCKLLGLAFFQKEQFDVLEIINGNIKKKTILVDENTIIVNQLLLGNGKYESGRERFTAAHELGHLILHSGPEYKDKFNIAYFSDDSNIPQDENKKLEAEADHFAASILMPKDSVCNLFSYLLRNYKTGADKISQTRSIIGKMAHKYNVSYTAMGIRLAKLGLIESTDPYLKIWD